MVAQKQDFINSDLDELLNRAGNLWDRFRGAHIFATGGTGFFGRWLLESFLLANQRKQLGASLTVLSRNPAAFMESVPHLCQDAALQFWQGDVRNFVPPARKFTHLIHAATDSSAPKGYSRIAHMDTIVGGTRRILDFAVSAGVTRMLYISSGAVYGRGRPETNPVSENEPFAPLVTDTTIEHDESKRMAEALCVLYNREYGLSVSIARCFSFVGPYLPLDAHFAIGNFIRDALAGGPIRVSGTGTALRSYLYASDLVQWLFTLLAHGKPAQPYNVGSDQVISIADLAQLVRKVVNPKATVEIAGVPVAGVAVNCQVPDIRLASQELGLRVNITLEEAIRRTADWCQKKLADKKQAAPVSVFAAPDAIIFDFDGVMTDNRVLVFEDAQEAVLCSRADGLGIDMLHTRAIPMLVLSKEKNPVVAARCKKLNLECLQGIDAKEPALTAWLEKHGYNPARSIYLGNDVNDLGCLALVGCPVAVGDAVAEVKAAAQIVLSCPGGHGAVRELADLICTAADLFNKKRPF